jgi:Outer membrane receptor proteins, mostly Fe transport
VTLQHTNNPKVYRYYRPHQDNSNWRLALATRLDVEDLDWGVADAAHVRFYVQHKEDQRRWYDAATGALEKWGVAKWLTVQASAWFEKSVGDHLVTWGLDFQSTDGESPDDEQFTITDMATGITRKAAPDSLWSSFGVFAQDTWDVSDAFTLVGSVRFDAFRFATDVDPLYVPPGGLDPSVDEFTDWEVALVGGLQVVWHATETTNVFGGWTRGFRMFPPHFGVTQHGWGILVPNKPLKPVTADQFEVGVKHRSEYLSADAAVYYTWFDNFQNIVRGTFQGSDWYDFNGNGIRDFNEDVYVTVGNGEADVFGVEMRAEVDLGLFDEDFFGRSWSVGAGFMWNYGRDRTNDIPLRHTHPARGLLFVRYEHPDPDLGLWCELSADFVRRYDRIPPSRLASDVGYLEDPQDPASGKRRTWGLPGYSVFDFRAGFHPCDKVTVNLGVDNIFDRLYRPAHSRWDAPGRNFWISVEVVF